VALTRRNGANNPFVWSGRPLQAVFIDLWASRSCICIRLLGARCCCGPSWISARLLSHYRSSCLRQPGYADAARASGVRFILPQTRQGNGTSSLPPDWCNRAVRPFLRARKSGASPSRVPTGDAGAVPDPLGAAPANRADRLAAAISSLGDAPRQSLNRLLFAGRRQPRIVTTRLPLAVQVMCADASCQSGTAALR
jgi:hypothetical protein